MKLTFLLALLAAFSAGVHAEENRYGTYRFDFPLERPLDLSAAAGVSFRLKCASVEGMTDCWLLFKSGDGFWRARTDVPAKGGEWTDAVVLRDDVRLYHWRRHISSFEVKEHVASEDVPDWRRVTGFQVSVALGPGGPPPADDAVAAVGFEPVVESSPRVAEARTHRAAREREMLSRVRTLRPVAGECRFMFARVRGLGNDWDASCRLLAAHGVTDVVPLVSSDGYAYYETKLEPVSPLVRRDGDALRDCLKACRKHGLKYHPWRICWTLNYTAPEEIVAAMRRAGRLQRTFDGGELKWLCPSHPENVRREVECAVELAQRGVDGILLDHFRFDDETVCFCDRCRAGFERTLGWTVANWPRDVRADAGLARKWNAHRADILTGILRTIRLRIRTVAPKVELFACPGSTAAWKEECAQDWPRWCREDLVDRVFTMSYFPSAERLRGALDEQCALLGNDRRKLCPLVAFACGKVPFVDPDVMCDEIREVRATGARDIGFFCLTEYAPYMLKCLREGPLADR